MRSWRFRTLYFVLLPAIAVASGVLGYYTWITASQFARLGKQSIAESTLLLVEEKVDVIEQFIIQADNDVFRLVDLSDPQSIDAAWKPVAEEATPSVRGVVVLDDTLGIVGFSFRGTRSEGIRFRQLFRERILGDLELRTLNPGGLKHLHRTYGSTNYLISYQTMRNDGRRFYAIAYHDTDYIISEEFESLFATEEGRGIYNVVDSSNDRVYGPNLAQAGDFLFGHRFPTTLYEWRLQVAPRHAPLLEQQAQSRQFSVLVLVITSLIVIILGVVFLIYAADKERRLNALKSEFIANVSHELKTPLSVIRMFGEMLLTGRVASKEKESQYIEIICGESERLSALIENVLDFSALERGKQRYEMTDGSIGTAITRAIEAFRYRVERDGIIVNHRPPATLPRTKLDEQAIMLATINLLDNAVKYGGGTPIDVEVTHDQERIVISVRDRGPGILEDDLRRVFDRFFRSQTNNSVRGSGIGLSLVSHIAQAHGGRAWARNAPDGGAIVSFSVAVDPELGERASIPGADSKPPSSPTESAA